MSTALFRQDDNRIVDSILTGDALTMLRTLPDNHVQTVVTSPPYYGLRDYGVDGQIGLESSPDEFIAKLVEVFREVRRVLREDGTLWLNIGDSYAGSWGNYAPGGIKGKQRSRTDDGKRWEREAYGDTKFLPPTAKCSSYGLKPKDLIGIPWMLAFALRADGWYLRMDCIWHKPNCMPESVKDRPTKSHEYLFLLSKSERYYYDAESIREPLQGGYTTEEEYIKRTNHKAHYEDGNSDPKGGGFRGFGGMSRDTVRFNPSGRNKRSVWTIATQPFKNAHFATMPQKLVEPCVLAGSSAQACEHCGSPWERVTERFQFGKAESNTAYTDDKMKPNRLAGSRQAYRAAGFESPPAPKTVGWQPTCTCPNEGTGKSIVLDPFAGAGTVPLVAIQHERHYLGIELNPEYVEMAERRIQQVLGLWEAV